jgi:hypothetical protein
MTLRKSILLFASLLMIAALVACSSSSNNTPATVTPSTSSNNQSVTVGGAFAALSVTVTNSSGNPVSGATVTFTAPATGASGTFASNSTNTETDTTNSSGVATSTVFTANTTAGTYSVQAAAGTVSGTFTLTNTAGAAATIAYSSPANGAENAAINGTYAPLAAIVTDSYSNPVSGASVTFTVTAGGSGASASFATSGATDTETTGANGIATTSQALTANATLGQFTVAASSGSLTPATFTLTNASGNLAITSGNSQSIVPSGSFAPLVSTVTDASGNPLQSISITYTITAGTSTATFSGTGTTTEAVTTDSNGNATVSDLTASATVGNFTVTAAPTTVTLAPASVTFNETIATSVGTAYLPAGNYVFYVSGGDEGGAPYTYQYTGVFTASGTVVSGSEAITGGEQDFSDYNEENFVSAEPITSGTITQSPDVGSGDNNLIITLQFTDGYINGGAGTTTLNVAMASATKGLLSEYDAWGIGQGELNLQTATVNSALCATAPTTPCGYVFAAGGLDGSGYPAANGGVIVVDGASGAISGTGSIFDNNDSCPGGTPCTGVATPGIAVGASTVTALDQYGLATFTINSPGNPTLIYDAYVIDGNRMRIVENWDADTYGGTTGGSALTQTTVGGFADSSVDGSTYVVSFNGEDTSAGEALQAAGQISFTSGNLGGYMSFNDSTVQNTQGGSAITAGTYSVDSAGAGDFALAGITDNAGDFLYNLQLYVTGDGVHALAISMDAGNTTSDADVLGGLGWVQGSGLSASSLSGTYALAQSQWQSGAYLAGDGLVTPSSGTITGYQDVNGTFAGEGLVADKSLGATYTDGPAAGIIDVTGTGSHANPLTMYLVDTTQGVIIENDTDLGLGYFTNQ